MLWFCWPVNYIIPSGKCITPNVMGRVSLHLLITSVSQRTNPTEQVVSFIIRCLVDCSEICCIHKTIRPNSYRLTLTHCSECLLAQHFGSWSKVSQKLQATLPWNLRLTFMVRWILILFVTPFPLLQHHHQTFTEPIHDHQRSNPFLLGQSISR